MAVLFPAAAFASSGVVAPRASGCETRTVRTDAQWINSSYNRISATMSWCWNKNQVYAVNPGYWKVDYGSADIAQQSSQTQYYNFNGTWNSGYMVLRYFKACGASSSGGTTCYYPSIRIYVHRDGGINWYTS